MLSKQAGEDIWMMILHILISSGESLRGEGGASSSHRKTGPVISHEPVSQAKVQSTLTLALRGSLRDHLTYIKKRMARWGDPVVETGKGSLKPGWSPGQLLMIRQSRQTAGTQDV